MPPLPLPLPVLLLLLASLAEVGCSLAAATKPNLIIILTDDQDVLLGGLEPMPKTRRLLQEQGATLSNFFVNTPICCPSRTALGCDLDRLRTTATATGAGV